MIDWATIDINRKSERVRCLSFVRISDVTSDALISFIAGPDICELVNRLLDEKDHESPKMPDVQKDADKSASASDSTRQDEKD